MEELTYKIVSAIYRSNKFHNIFGDTSNYNKLQDIVDKAVQGYNKESEFRKNFNMFIKDNF